MIRSSDRRPRVRRPPRFPPPRSGARDAIERHYFRHAAEARRAALGRLQQLGGNYRLVHQPSRRRYSLERVVSRRIGERLRVFFVYDADRDRITQSSGETELEAALRRVDSAVREAEGATWRHHLRASAVNQIGRIQGLPPAIVVQRLRDAGFRPGSPSVRGSVVWWHADGSRVRVDPPHGGPRGFPSDRRVHYHKYFQLAGGPSVLVSDRGRIVPALRRDPMTGRLVPRNPRRTPAAHILSGARRREAEASRSRGHAGAWA